MESRLTTPAQEAGNCSSERLVDDFKAVIHRAEQRAIERARAADRLVRDHPYPTLGMALGAGVLIGVLVGRKWT